MNYKNKILVLIHAIAIVLIIYCILLLQIFANPESINYHLKTSGSYNYLSEIVKSAIENRFPPELNDKILQKALAERLLNYFVTPALTERLAQPLLKTGAFVTKQQTSIEDNKVVIETKTYKDRITAELSETKIPDSLQNASQKIVAAIPETITLVDLDQRPNSVLGFLTKAKMYYERVSVLNWILIATALTTFLLLIFLNLRFLKQILLSIAYGYSSAGVFVVLGSWALPYIFSNFVPGDSHPVFGDQLNLFANNSITYFFNLSRKYGWLYLLIGLIAFLLWRWSVVERLQLSLGSRFSKNGKSFSTVPAKKTISKKH